MEKEDRVILNRVRIGQELSKARTDRGLTVRALAEKAGVSYQNITKIENGRYNVSIDILGDVLDAMGCEITITKRQEE